MTDGDLDVEARLLVLFGADAAEAYALSVRMLRAASDVMAPVWSLRASTFLYFARGGELGDRPLGTPVEAVNALVGRVFADTQRTWRESNRVAGPPLLWSSSVKLI